MLRLVIDGNEANVDQPVGSNTYAAAVLHHLHRIARDRGWHVEVWLSSEPVATLPAEHHSWRYLTFGPKKYWTQWSLPVMLDQRKAEFDVMFSPGHYGPRTSPLPTVVSIMDTAYEEYPHFFKVKDRVQLRNWTKSSVKQAAKIIAISQFTKKCVANTYHRSLSDIVVAYPALEPVKPWSLADTNDWLAAHDCQGPFFLFIGTLQPRKQITVLIKAFEQLVAAQPKQSATSYRSGNQQPDPPHLIIAGREGWLCDDVLRAVKESPYANYIHQVDYIDANLKAALIKKSEAVVLMGLHEGFGIPILEAMTYGTLPIVSKSGSLPELVGSAGMQVTPSHSLQLCKRMQEVLVLSSRERSLWLAKGRERATHFDWRQSALLIADTLEEVAATHAKTE